VSHFPLTNARAFAVRKRDGERVEFGKRLLLRANLPRLAGGHVRRRDADGPPRATRVLGCARRCIDVRLRLPSLQVLQRFGGAFYNLELALARQWVEELTMLRDSARERGAWCLLWSDRRAELRDCI